MENKLKIESKSERRRKGPSIFSGLEKRMRLETYFEDGFPVTYLPKIMFGFFLSLAYISNTHYAEKTTRAIHPAQSEVEDLRADFPTLKEDVMFASQKREVARRVKFLGLKERVKPPFKISEE